MDKIYLSGSTSKGNQPKFIKGVYLYKEDMMGYESVSEALVSEFLGFIEDIKYIDYFLEEVDSKKCCKSKIYTSSNESFVSIYKLLEKSNKLRYLNTISGRDALEYVIESVFDITKIDIRDYLCLLSIIDSIILNEDRHLNNICLIEKEGKYRVAPIFDNGLSLLSDTVDYRMDTNLSVLIRMVKCKPFSTSFSKQVGYFDYKPLKIDYAGFIEKMDVVVKNIDSFVPFKQVEFLRALEVLKRRLKMTEGDLWMRK